MIVVIVKNICVIHKYNFKTCLLFSPYYIDMYINILIDYINKLKGTFSSQYIRTYSFIKIKAFLKSF